MDGVVCRLFAPASCRDCDAGTEKHSGGGYVGGGDGVKGTTEVAVEVTFQENVSKRSAYG